MVALSSNFPLRESLSLLLGIFFRSDLWSNVFLYITSESLKLLFMWSILCSYIHSFWISAVYFIYAFFYCSPFNCSLSFTKLWFILFSYLLSLTVFCYNTTTMIYREKIELTSHDQLCIRHCYLNCLYFSMGTSMIKYCFSLSYITQWIKCFL